MSDQYLGSGGSFAQSASETMTGASGGFGDMAAGDLVGSGRSGEMTPEGTESPGEQSGGMLSGAKEKAGEVAGQATDKLDAGKEKAAGGLDVVAGTLREKAGAIGGGQLQGPATAVADAVSSGAEMLRSKDSEQLITELEDLIRRKPVESLVAAAAVGFVLSKALR